MATVENVQDAGITGRTITVYFPEDKIRALVIRGTTLQQDWFRNLALYAEVVVLQAEFRLPHNSAQKMMN